MIRRAKPPYWGFVRIGRHPFKVFFHLHNCRVILTEGISHNAKWIHWLQESDQVITALPWNYTAERFLRERDFLIEFGHDVKNWWILCNTPEQQNDCLQSGLQGFLVNNNCWLDEKSIPLCADAKKIYRAIYTARAEAYKNHDLAASVKDLALVIGQDPFNRLAHISCKWKNSSPLARKEVYAKIAQSRCGLALSSVEGAMYASSEYLLCGIPVVSIPSLGGRGLYYNDSNSLVCEPSAENVALAVDEICQRLDEGFYDPEKIRNDHIELSKLYRQNFITVLTSIFDKFDVMENAEQYFHRGFRHKMMGKFIQESSIQKLLAEV